MRIRHRSKEPKVHPLAYVAPTAVLSGDVEIGEGSRILHGVVITAEGAPVRIGRRCVIMENAVVRSAGGTKIRFPVSIGDYTLIGPHAYLVGCTIADRCFIATGATIFNGAHLKRGSEVTLHGIVHVGTTLEEGQWVPIKHVAIGSPARIFTPGDTDAMMAALREQRFTLTVFGVDSDGRSDADVYEALTERYARALEAHFDDEVLDPD